MSYNNTKNFEEQGGEKWVVGGTIEVTGTLTATAGTNHIVLPSADPHVVGVLWNNAGTVTVSAG